MSIHAEQARSGEQSYPPNRSPKDIRRNFFLMTIHSVVFRMGWIFKTETVLMPAFLDMLGASATVRGALPMLQKICQSGPQISMAHVASRLARLKWVYFFLMISAAAPWLIQAFLCRIGQPFAPGGLAPSVMIGLFLVIFLG